MALHHGWPCVVLVAFMEICCLWCVYAAVKKSCWELAKTIVEFESPTSSDGKADGKRLRTDLTHVIPRLLWHSESISCSVMSKAVAFDPKYPRLLMTPLEFIASGPIWVLRSAFAPIFHCIFAGG